MLFHITSFGIPMKSLLPRYDIHPANLFKNKSHLPYVKLAKGVDIRAWRFCKGCCHEFQEPWKFPCHPRFKELWREPWPWVVGGQSSPPVIGASDTWTWCSRSPPWHILMCSCHRWIFVLAWVQKVQLAQKPAPSQRISEISGQKIQCFQVQQVTCYELSGFLY